MENILNQETTGEGTSSPVVCSPVVVSSPVVSLSPTAGDNTTATGDKETAVTVSSSSMEVDVPSFNQNENKNLARLRRWGRKLRKWLEKFWPNRGRGPNDILNK